MKKTLSFVLALLMLVCVMPFAVSAADYDVYGPNELDGSAVLAMTGLYGTVADEGDVSYIHGVVQPGTYNNNTLQVAIAPTDFCFADYPYIKIEYRTDAPSNIIDVSSRSSVGESWYGVSMPKNENDGQWHTLIVEPGLLTGGKGLVPAGDVGASLVLKPYSALTVTLNKASYFDVRYVGFFKDKADAEKYKFKASDDSEVASWEEVDVVYEKATDEMIDKYMAEADALIEEIKNSATSVEVTGTKYYVANSGSDTNDGLTPETAWKTVARVNSFEDFKPGDGVFFKRGDSWRQTVPLSAKSGVTYSAYGSGAKPKIISSVDGSGADKWIPTEFENIYAYTDPIPGVERDVGTIVFDGGRAWGIQIQRTREGNRLEIGRVFNGLEWFDTTKGKFEDQRDLDNDLEFYHKWETNTLYVYSKDGNPGERFTSIEIVDKGHGISLVSDEATGDAHDIVIDNIEIFGAGSHGIGGGNVRNVTVQYCVLTWIGGSVQGRYIFNSNYGVRFGNAVESYGNSDNFVIHHCYASQVYDCCWTVQLQEAATFKDVQMYSNVSEFCNTGLEVWQTGGTITNMQLHDNYTRYNGYGWSHQRPNKDGNFFYGATSTSGTFADNDVYNNINLFASYCGLKVAATGESQYNFHDNIYVMENDKYIGYMAANPGLGKGAVGNQAFDEKTIKRAVGTGFEKGGEFYYTEPSPFGNMYDLYNPEIGVDQFGDVADNFWGRDAVDYVSLRGYFNGVAEGKFSTDGTMTRAMLVTVLSRIAGETANGNNATFTDINKNAWYAGGVAWAEKNGIVNAGGKFRPDENATREELADMLYRYAQYVFRKVDLSKAEAFKDSASVTAAYADGVKFCTLNGIIGGYSDGTIRPKNSATRAEVATMIMRFNKYLEKSPIDVDKVLADADYTTVKGDGLKKMLDNTGVRATTEADGTVKFVPFLDTGAPVVRIMDSLNKDISFIDKPYVAIKYSGELDSAFVIAGVDFISPTGGKTYAGVKSSAGTADGGILVDLSTLVSDTYADNVAINLWPWGEAEIALDKTDFFVVEEVIFFNSLIAAKAYLG